MSVLAEIEKMVGQHHVFYFADGPEDMTEGQVMEKIKKSSGDFVALSFACMQTFRMRAGEKPIFRDAVCAMFADSEIKLL